MAVLTPVVSGVRADAGDDDLDRESRERLADLGARAMTSALFVVLAVRIGAEFQRTGHLTGLLLLVSEALVVALTVFRRPAVAVDRALWTRIVAGISMVGIPFIKPVGEPLAPDLVTASFSAVGLLVIITGKLTLGRSFGLMPANRGIVCRGIYRTVRHPIYAGYLVTHLAFVVAHPAPWNVMLVLVSDTALLIRATFEERTLALDPEYAAYLTRVRWRVAPGLF